MMSAPYQFRRFLALLALLAGAQVHAEIVPPRGVSDSRVRTVNYVADQVYRLEGYVGYAIHIELQAGEEYRGMGAGDIDAISVDARDRDVFIKPRVLSAATNLTLLTNRRRYQFQYSASDRQPDPLVDDVIYSLRFVYPEPAVSEANVAERALEDRQHVSSRAMNFDYWYCGHPALRPIAAWDDGVQTRIRFSPRSEMPALFVKNQDDTESLLNFSVDDSNGDVVVHRIAPALILRRGRVTGCIVNRAYAGSGERLPTATLSPDVTRELREVRP